MPLPTTPGNTTPLPVRASWTFSLLTGALTVVAAAFGGYLAACGGILQAITFTLLLFFLFMPVVPPILLGSIGITLAVAVTVRWLSATAWMSDRIMLAFLVPFLGLVVGWILGWQAGSPSSCVLKT